MVSAPLLISWQTSLNYVIGIHLTIFALCFRLLFLDPRRTRQVKFFLAYITLNLILCTLGYCSSTLHSGRALIGYHDGHDRKKTFGQELLYPASRVNYVLDIVGSWSTCGLLVRLSLASSHFVRFIAVWARCVSCGEGLSSIVIVHGVGSCTFLPWDF